MNFITILNSPQSFKIGIIRNLFDMENIQYRVLDEFTSNAAGVAGLGINGIRVQVIEEDLTRAQKLLEDVEFD